MLHAETIGRGPTMVAEHVRFAWYGSFSILIARTNTICIPRPHLLIMSPPLLVALHVLVNFLLSCCSSS